jgi:putative permease
MYNLLKEWYLRHCSDPEAIILLLTLVFVTALVLTTGSLLAPVFASVVIAYLLQGMVVKLQRWRCPHLLAVSLVCLVGVGAILIMMLWFMPLAWQETSNFVNELPVLLQHMQSFLMRLPQNHPDYISALQVQHFIATVKQEVALFGKAMLSFSVASIPGFIELIVYAILVPMMVFFFLKDSQRIFSWLGRFLPRQARLVHQVRDEVNVQIGHYIRGKFIELLIIFILNAILFKVLGLRYSIILAFFSGISVLVPYIGVLLVSIPVVAIAYAQFGLTPHFAYLTIAYAIVMVLDGNVLVPLLFSETMSIHPVAIIIAIIFFGGIWGFWGVFFAIPLATVVKAVIDAWPATPTEQPELSC